MVKKQQAPVIVVTGGTGSGKSTVAAVFKKLGARIIDVDCFARRLLKPGTLSWHEILWEFCGAKLHHKKNIKKSFVSEDFVDLYNCFLETVAGDSLIRSVA